MIAANKSWLAVFDGLEAVHPGISYIEILQFATEEGIIDIGDTPPVEWRETMLDRWQTAFPEPAIIQLWNGQFIKLIDQRGASGDVVSLAHNITDTIRYEPTRSKARQRRFWSLSMTCWITPKSKPKSLCCEKRNSILSDVFTS
jgi:hypothetical protein